MKVKINRRRIFFYIILAVFIGVFVYSAVQIIRIQSDYSKGVKEYDYLFNQAIILDDDHPEYTGYSDNPFGNTLGFSIDYSELYDMNNDYIGWIFIPGTAINYPMVAGRDNEYYLHNTFMKEYNFAGTLFLDYMTNSLASSNTIIYGHRMNNGSMFADLEKYLDETFYKGSKYVYVFTEHDLLVYEIFSCRVVGLEDDCYTIGFTDDDAFNQWVFRMKTNSRYQTSLVQKANGKVITLSTCVRNDETSRIIVQAQLLNYCPLG